MFVINANQSQVLSVNVEYSLDYFLFYLPDLNGKMFYADADYSNIPRCLDFTIQENATEDLLNGVVSLPIAGDYYCKIYNTTSKTLELPTSEPIWRGLFRVFRSSTTIIKNTIGVTYVGYDPR